MLELILKIVIALAGVLAGYQAVPRVIGPPSGVACEAADAGTAPQPDAGPSKQP
jgi:hypothetical protein